MADRLPLPEPIGIVWSDVASQMRKYAYAENAALRAELAKHQESEFHPDWSMLAATRDSLAEHQDMIRRLSKRIKVLEDALRGVLHWVVTEEIACNGLKCREDVCMSCKSDSKEAAQKARDAYIVASSALEAK